MQHRNEGKMVTCKVQTPDRVELVPASAHVGAAGRRAFWRAPCKLASFRGQLRDVVTTPARRFQRTHSLRAHSWHAVHEVFMTGHTDLRRNFVMQCAPCSEHFDRYIGSPLK